MKKNKINWEEDEDNPDVYDEEAALMRGYMGGEENEEELQ